MSKTVGQFNLAMHRLIDTYKYAGKFGRKVARNAVRANLAYKPGKIGPSAVCEEVKKDWKDPLPRSERRKYNKQLKYYNHN